MCLAGQEASAVIGCSSLAFLVSQRPGLGPNRRAKAKAPSYILDTNANLSARCFLFRMMFKYTYWWNLGMKQFRCNDLSIGLPPQGRDISKKYLSGHKMIKRIGKKKNINTELCLFYSDFPLTSWKLLHYSNKIQHLLLFVGFTCNQTAKHPVIGSYCVMWN